MIKRTILSELEDHLASKEITLITGPRQAGKTTIMLILKNQLEQKGLSTLFLNLDIEADMRFFYSQEVLIKKIELELGRKEGFVFIDEIQRKENAGRFLKGLYDMNLPYKFIVSGSGSIELKEKIHESLAGRKRIFELNTISFDEFVNFKTQYKYEDRLIEYCRSDPEKVRLYLDDYLLFGGYPRVILAENINEKKQVISDIFQSYLEKDIAYLLQIKKTEALSKLVRIIAAQPGTTVNFSGLSSILGVSIQTVKDYLWYLEKTFILNKVSPYFRNLRKEIRKSPAFYFYDLGLRNYAAGSFGYPNHQELGFIFQNFIFNLLKERIRVTPGEIHFWQTADKAEVDFVIDFAHSLLPVEVKFADLKKAMIPRSFRSFISQYKPSKAYIINLSLKETVHIEKTVIFFIPFYELFYVDMC